MKTLDLSVFITAIGVLVIVTNALTELFKAMFKNISPQIAATVIALILTVCAVFAYISITKIPLEWYYVVGAVIAGFFVSYTAQFGYDKLNEIIKLLGAKKAAKLTESEDNNADKGD